MSPMAFRLWRDQLSDHEATLVGACLGYPHGLDAQCPQWIPAERDEVEALIRRIREGSGAEVAAQAHLGSKLAHREALSDEAVRIRARLVTEVVPPKDLALRPCPRSSVERSSLLAARRCEARGRAIGLLSVRSPRVRGRRPSSSGARRAADVEDGCVVH